MCAHVPLPIKELKMFDPLFLEVLCPLIGGHLGASDFWKALCSLQITLFKDSLEGIWEVM